MSAVLHSLVGHLPAGYLIAEIALCALVLQAKRLNQRAQFQAACAQLTLEVDIAFHDWENGQTKSQ